MRAMNRSGRSAVCLFALLISQAVIAADSADEYHVRGVSDEEAEEYGLVTDDWVSLEVAHGPGSCRLKVRVSDETRPGVVRTGMGWWYPEATGPERGALDVNINAAMRYDGPWDPVTGSVDTRGLPCRLTKTNAAAAAE